MTCHDISTIFKHQTRSISFYSAGKKYQNNCQYKNFQQKIWRPFNMISVANMKFNIKVHNWPGQQFVVMWSRSSDHTPPDTLLVFPGCQVVRGGGGLSCLSCLPGKYEVMRSWPWPLLLPLPGSDVSRTLSSASVSLSEPHTSSDNQLHNSVHSQLFTSGIPNYNSRGQNSQLTRYYIFIACFWKILSTLKCQIF